MPREIPQTPSRRSGRGQPLATSSEEADHLHRAWSGQPLYIRPINRVLDDVDPRVEDEGESDDDYETVFYSSMVLEKRHVSAFGRTGRQTEADTRATYHLGDTVLMESDGLSHKRGLPSVGIILAMWETRRKGSQDASDPAKMRIRLQWFLRPGELGAFGTKREPLENEIYYKINGRAVTLPQCILGPCKVTSKPPATTQVKSQTSSKKRRGGWIYETGGVEGLQDYYCRFAYQTKGDQRGYYNVDWEKHHDNANLSTTRPPPEIDLDWGNSALWEVELPAERTRKRKKGKKDDESGSESGNATDDNYEEQSDIEMDDAAGSMDDDDSDESASNPSGGIDEPRTPSKKRKRGVFGFQSPSKRRAEKLATPRKPGKRTVVHPTPHSKAALRKRAKAKGIIDKFAIRPETLSFAAHDLSHLPKDPWLRAMNVLHVGSRPDALPCREEEFERVLRCVGELLEEGSGGCIYISGVPGTGKTATVHAVVRQLKRMADNSETDPFNYVEINGLKIPEPSAAYSVLWQGLSGNDSKNMSSKESLKALTQYFSGGRRGPESHACVVLMDELDQLVTAKQDVVYNFFNWPTLVASRLVVIAVANTMDLPERVMTGRVRSRLGMTRINFSPYTATQLQTIVHSRLKSVKDALEENTHVPLSDDAIKLAAMKVSGISGDARRVLDICRRTVEMVMPEHRMARAPEVKEVIKVMQNSPTAAYLRECSFHERMMLASLIKCIKREGVLEIKWGEVQHQHLIYMNVLTSPSDPTRKPTPGELTLVLDSLVSSRAMLIEDGATIQRKPEGDRLVVLTLDQGEVERVLGEVGGTRWKNVLNT
ncbi:hypothetical protein C0991_006368 [Blastosporella zonata]|nr:hypothetical protein C0991_006368 [Blastosporella zonata]